MKMNCNFHVIAYKHSGRFDQYATLVESAFQELNRKRSQIPTCTDTTVAIYEPRRGPDHVEGFFYVGVIVEGKPMTLPEGSYYMHIEGTYSSAKGQIKDIGKIYESANQWIREHHYEPIWPDGLIVERYESPIPDVLTFDEEVEVLLPIHHKSP